MTEKIKKLLEYQQADIDLMNIKREITQSPNRIKLYNSRDFLLKQKENIDKINAETSQMNDRLEVIQYAVDDLEKQLTALQEKFENNKPEDVNQVEEQMQAIRTLVSDILAFEKELKSISKKSTNNDKQEYNMRIKTARVKQDFMELKDIYNKEYAEQKIKLAKLSAIAEEKKKNVDEELLNKYEEIKQHIFPPIARLHHNQCGGCDMALPSVTLGRFNSGEEYLECSNCGRLIVKEG